MVHMYKHLFILEKNGPEFVKTLLFKESENSWPKSYILFIFFKMLKFSINNDHNFQFYLMVNYSGHNVSTLVQ